ncbi:MAG: hypothetical protein ACFFD4_30805 [Candidatus Odinarchaeota archaeon]
MDDAVDDLARLEQEYSRTTRWVKALHELVVEVIELPYTVMDDLKSFTGNLAWKDLSVLESEVVCLRDRLTRPVNAFRTAITRLDEKVDLGTEQWNTREEFLDRRLQLEKQKLPLEQLTNLLISYQERVVTELDRLLAVTGTSGTPGKEAMTGSGDIDGIKNSIEAILVITRETRAVLLKPLVSCAVHGGAFPEPVIRTILASFKKDLHSWEILTLKRLTREQGKKQTSSSG